MNRLLEHLFAFFLGVLGFLGRTFLAALNLVLLPLRPFKPMVLYFWEKHSAVLFSLLAFFIAILLFFSKGLRSVDDYLQAMVYQHGYTSSKPMESILVVKKDERTAALLGRSIGRKDFASTIAFLGTPQRINLSEGQTFSSWKVVDLKLGCMKAGDKPILSSGFLDLKVVASSPEDMTLFRYAETFDRLFSRHWEFPPLSPPVSSATQILMTKAWNNALKSVLEIKFKFFPRPDTVFQMTMEVIIDNSLYLEIPPARVIGFDFILQGLKDREPEIDDLLEQAITKSQAPIILVAQIEGKGGEVADSRVEAVHADKRSEKLATEEVTEILPHEKFIKGEAQVALANASPDTKNYLSCFPLFMYSPSQKKLRPSFALNVAATALDRRYFPKGEKVYQRAMLEELDRILSAWEQKTYQGGFQLRDRFIPTDDRGSMYVYFFGSTHQGARGKGVLPSVSMFECFEGKDLKVLAAESPEKAEMIKTAYTSLRGIENNTGNVICLIGPCEKTDFDSYSTPLTMDTPFKIQNELLMGIEFHANAIADILENRCLKPANAKDTLVLLFFSTLLLGFLLDFLKPATGTVTAVLFTVGIYAFSFYLYNVRNQIFLFSPFLISYPLTWASSTLVHYLRQRERANMTKAMFSSFVAPEVVKYLMDNPDAVNPGGQKVELTIFFSDLAGFTTISEGLTPEKLVVFMNQYLGEMTDILLKHNGTLDKYIGDAVMAFWNFPRSQEDHAVKACLYTLEMHKRIQELQKEWGSRGLPKAYARAGINTAHVVVGVMGSAKGQRSFTCLGDGVNLASRLEGANKEYGTLYMISDTTYQKVKHRIRGRFLDFLAVKGKKEPVVVHELVSEIGKEPAGWDELAALYDKGIKLHLDRSWNEAIASFEQILARWPDDGPSQTYLKRCQEYRENPPPANWNGSYIMTHK